MKKVFDTEQAIKDYILRSASDPTNQFVNQQGEPCLSYRHLKTQVGVSCYVLWHESVLLLERSPKVKYAGQWGTVSGYVDNLPIIQHSRQPFRDHIIQEFREEVGWCLDDRSPLRYSGTHALIKPALQIHLELFTLLFEENPPEIRLNSEHLSYRWMPLSQVSSVRSFLIGQFIEGLKACRVLV